MPYTSGTFLPHSHVDGKKCNQIVKDLDWIQVVPEQLFCVFVTEYDNPFI